MKQRKEEEKDWKSIANQRSGTRSGMIKIPMYKRGFTVLVWHKDIFNDKVNKTCHGFYLDLKHFIHSVYKGWESALKHTTPTAPVLHWTILLTCCDPSRGDGAAVGSAPTGRAAGGRGRLCWGAAGRASGRGRGGGRPGGRAATRRAALPGPAGPRQPGHNCRARESTEQSTRPQRSTQSLGPSRESSESMAAGTRSSPGTESRSSHLHQ